MDYRTFKKTGEEISLLGFGTMRLPVLDGDNGKIDEAQAIAMIRRAIDLGVNYMDTAYMYHAGTSEEVLGEALKDGYREKVFLADKMPVWMAKEAGGIEALFDNQLRKLDVDLIDFYLLHALDTKVWRKAKQIEALPFLEKMKEQGRIGKIGFSFHDDLDVFKTIIDEYPWDFCQIQLNYMDTQYQAGVEGLKYAAAKGLPVIIMEPLKGGKLTTSLPGSVQALWAKAPVQRAPVEWALRFLADFPEVLTILSGMNSVEQLEENVRILSGATAGSLTAEEHEIIKSVAKEYKKLIKVSCTNCKYCMPCPQKISIPEVIDFYNQWYLYRDYTSIKRDFELNIPRGRRASDCLNCKACEKKCPQHLPITEILRETAEILE